MKTLRLFLLAITLLTVNGAAQVKLARVGDRVDVSIDGQPFTSFYCGADAPKPYLHPLRSASGKIVTRGFPMIPDVPGESHDHPHHRGLWFTHGDVNGVDYWAEGPGKGRVVLVSLSGLMSGREAGSLQARFHWKTPQGAAVVEEDRTMTFRRGPNLRIIDVQVLLRPAGNEAVKFGDTKEGTFAIRLARPLEEKTPKCAACTGIMRSSEGTQGEKQIWGKRAEWVDYSGTVEGETLGIAIFDHPQNPKHPTFWHARAYGLFAANPFGEHDFFNDKTRDGSLTIQPGESLKFRYRVVIHSGDTAAAAIAEQYRKYSP